MQFGDTKNFTGWCLLWEPTRNDVHIFCDWDFLLISVFPSNSQVASSWDMNSCFVFNNQVFCFYFSEPFKPPHCFYPLPPLTPIFSTPQPPNSVENLRTLSDVLGNEVTWICLYFDIFCDFCTFYHWIHHYFAPPFFRGTYCWTGHFLDQESKIRKWLVQDLSKTNIPWGFFIGSSRLEGLITWRIIPGLGAVVNNHG